MRSLFGLFLVNEASIMHEIDGSKKMADPITWTEETRPIASLKGHPRNPRKITPDQRAKLKAAVIRVGYHHPIAIQPNGEIISGHQRHDVLTEIGETDIRVSVPSRPLDDAEQREMMVQANLTAGEFDFSILAADFSRQELIALGMQPSLMKDFDKQLRVGRASPDEIVAQQDRIVSKLGDIWICAGHRVMCGDATNTEHVEKLFTVGPTLKVKPNLMVTDPPYGVNYDPTWRDDAGGQFGDGKAKMRGKVEADDRADWREAWALFPGNVAYVWCASLHNDTVIISLEHCGFKRRAQIIWRKPHFQLSRGDYHWQHEPMWYAVRNKAKWQGARDQSTIWDIAGMNPAGRNTDEGNDRGFHGTQKPVECMRRPMEHNSAPGDAVYDPFLGSGSSLIAAQQCGRICLGLEIMPGYVDAIIRRWEKFTGDQATHAETGETFKSAEAAGVS